MVPDSADVRFFFGRRVGIHDTSMRIPREDEVFLDCDDTYQGLPNKVQEIMRWAKQRDYDFVLKCDDDTVIKPSALLASGFDKADFTGWQDPGCKHGEIRTPWGFCYWLSRRAINLVVDAPLPGLPGSIHSHVHNNDEAWISTILHYNDIFLQSDPRYFLYLGEKPKNKRSLRRPTRPEPPVRLPVSGAFAFCVYLNWSGFHATPSEVIIGEFHRLFKEYV